jgi:hypothetical protein
MKMLNTSHGFHTFTICKKLTTEDAEKLRADFRSAGLRVRPDRGKNKFDPLGYNWIIEYPNGSKGISWTLRIRPAPAAIIFTEKGASYKKLCSVKATINPKVFIGIRDYIAAANASYLSRVEAQFDSEAGSISPVLGSFEDYGLTRNDYCLNIDVKELNLPCTVENMMTLIKRGDIPPHYAEWMKYDGVSHRMKPGEDSFYLKSKSVVVNYYSKYQQLYHEYPDCPNLEASRNVIRLEIQFRYPKVYSLSKILRDKSGFSNSEIVREMLSDGFCADVISRYFHRVIGVGNYSLLETAKRMIQSREFHPKKEARLIAALSFTNSSRGVAKAKAKLDGEELEEYRRSLRELGNLGINPVTIPREWGISHIPNLLDTYYSKTASDEMLEQCLCELSKRRHAR